VIFKHATKLYLSDKCIVVILLSGYCLYGDSRQCVFQCHCAVDSECDGGQCSSGCDTAPLGYNWAGPVVQIGKLDRIPVSQRLFYEVLSLLYLLLHSVLRISIWNFCPGYFYGWIFRLELSRVNWSGFNQGQG